MEHLAFSPNRLKLARRRRGLTKVGLAEQVGLTARRLSSFENEGETPSPKTIEHLAQALRFPVRFFFRPEPPELSADTATFRSFSRLAARKRDAALAAAALAVEVGQWLDRRFYMPEMDLPDLRGTDPATAAAALRSAWALGWAPAPNLVHLLEAHGVHVFSLVDDCAELDALSIWHDATPLVFLTRHKSAERSRWDAAHELGHLVLHLGAPPQGQEQEQEADAFAAELLMPTDGIRASVIAYPSLIDVRREKLYWQVSAVAYIRRMHHLRVITDWQYRSLVVEAAQAGYRRREGDIERESSQLLTRVLQMLRDDGIGLDQIAVDLGVGQQELRDLMFSPMSLVRGEGAGIGDRSAPSHLRVLP